MRAQAYHDLLDKQRQELNDFPITYAFSKEQLEESLVKLGNPDISECCTVCNHGDIMRKTDVQSFLTMLERHKIELHELLKDPDLAQEIFEYEMDNHEYAINWDGDADVLGSLCLVEDDLEKMNLQLVYRLARRNHMKRAHEEWGMI